MRENNLARIKKGDPVEFILDAAPGRVFNGTVRSIGFGVDDDCDDGNSSVYPGADDTCDGEMCPTDLLGQAEHGTNSPAILLTNSQKIVDDTLVEIEKQLKTLHLL